MPSATGAARPVVLGSITPGRAYSALLRKVVTDQQEPPHRIELVAGKSEIGEADQIASGSVS